MQIKYYDMSDIDCGIAFTFYTLPTSSVIFMKAMVRGAINELGESCENMTVTKVVLLDENGTICRRNTLTRLHENGIIVMRCSGTDSDEEDDSGTSSE